MMLTRRNMLRWAVGMAACIPIGVGIIPGWRLLGASHAQEPDPLAQAITMEKWMNEWMSVSKAPGGVLKLSRFREPIYFLIAPISWTPNPGQEAYEAITVPTGFVTDLASIPPIFYPLLRPDGEYAHAAVVHDYLYWTQTRSREEADKILKMEMRDFEVPSLTIEVIYDAVRIGGKMAWDDNTRKKSQGEKRILTRFPQDPRTKWDDWRQRPGVFAP